MMIMHGYSRVSPHGLTKEPKWFLKSKFVNLTSHNTRNVCLYCYFIKENDDEKVPCYEYLK